MPDWRQLLLEVIEVSRFDADSCNGFELEWYEFLAECVECALCVEDEGVRLEWEQRGFGVDLGAGLEES